MLTQTNQPIAPSTDIYISQSTHNSIADLAMQLQAHYAIESAAAYDARDLQQAVLKWLESSIESLVDDGMFHLVEGRRENAFNRSEFDRQLGKLQPIEAVQPIVAAA
ncbi:MAG TPA: hypothetical protein V6D10_20555 [Trichocoleus sp.]|jgi:hypothetical protein